jgi:hypothetical protein
MKWTVPKMWDGGECFIIGGGASIVSQFNIPQELVEQVKENKTMAHLYSPYMKALHNKHIIGVNNAFMLGDWVDCCFFGDCAWYLVYRLNLAKFVGLKVTCCPRFAEKPEKRCEGVKYLAKDSKRYGITDNLSGVSWNHNSGAAAISLAVHFGVKRIILLGFDMCLNDEKVSHWHGTHGNKKPPPFPRHLKGFPAIADDASKLGVEILNASLTSAIEVFTKRPIKDLL